MKAYKDQNTQSQVAAVFKTKKQQQQECNHMMLKRANKKGKIGVQNKKEGSAKQQLSCNLQPQLQRGPQNKPGIPGKNETACKKMTSTIWTY